MKVPITYQDSNSRRVRLNQHNHQAEQAVKNWLMIAVIVLSIYALFLTLAAQGWN